MCPTDTTPDPRDMLHTHDEPEFLQPRKAVDANAPRAAGDKDAAADAADTDIARRPALPDHPVITAADIEDEEADPVGSDRPGTAERFQSDSTLQRG